MSSTDFIARLIGLYCVVFALAILINRRSVVGAIEKVAQDQAALLIIEVFGLAAGLAIVIGHEVWTNPLGIVVTLLGWIMVLRGGILLLLPSEKIAEVFAFAAWPQRSQIYALATLGVGVLLTLGSFA